MKKKLLFFLRIAFFSISLWGIFFYTTDAKDIKLSLKSTHTKDLTPVKFSGVDYIPLRTVFESFGYSIKWDCFKKSVFCAKDSSTLQFKLSQKGVLVNNHVKYMAHPLIVVKNMSYVPVEFVIQQLGVKVRWNKKDNVIITSGEDVSSVTVNGGRNIVISGAGLIINIFEPCSKDTLNDMTSLSDRLLGRNNPKDAIIRYNEILDNISPEDMPDLYARIMNNLGNAYNLLAQIGDTDKNAENAIALYQKAISYYKNNSDAVNINIIHNNLGNTYQLLAEITGKKQYKELAVFHYKQALNFYVREKYPLDYGLIQYNLGTSYTRLGLSEQANECLSKAEAIFIKTLDTYPIEKNPAFYALINYNLANIYSSYPEILLREGGVEKVVKYCEEALKVWTLESEPVNHAKVQQCLGQFYAKCFEEGGALEDLDKSKAAYDKCLKIFSFERYPFNYAKVNYALGNTYMHMEKLVGSKLFHTYAITSYTNSLKVFTAKHYSKYYKAVLDALEKAEMSE